ncbi:hypothetical protein V1514DRAFT_328652 [Lipomyces japonicus]|uniref:uncharacterized protein n=1 Tax=Lipomyces japonicus TaxID=56871 RepID=UPI0034CD3C4A
MIGGRLRPTTARWSNIARHLQSRPLTYSYLQTAFANDPQLLDALNEAYQSKSRQQRYVKTPQSIYEIYKKNGLTVPENSDVSPSIAQMPKWSYYFEDPIITFKSVIDSFKIPKVLDITFGENAGVFSKFANRNSKYSVYEYNALPEIQKILSNAVDPDYINDKNTMFYDRPPFQFKRLYLELQKEYGDNDWKNQFDIIHFSSTYDLLFTTPGALWLSNILKRNGVLISSWILDPALNSLLSLESKRVESSKLQASNFHENASDHKSHNSTYEWNTSRQKEIEEIKRSLSTATRQKLKSYRISKSQIEAIRILTPFVQKQIDEDNAMIAKSFQEKNGGGDVEYNLKCSQLQQEIGELVRKKTQTQNRASGLFATDFMDYTLSSKFRLPVELSDPAEITLKFDAVEIVEMWESDIRFSTVTRSEREIIRKEIINILLSAEQDEKDVMDDNGQMVFYLYRRYGLVYKS